MTFFSICMVALGGGMGSICRAACSNFVKTYWHRPFPLATFCINICGSLALGLLAGFDLSASLYSLLGTGFLGGFTTFSTLHTEALALVRGETPTIGVWYLCASYFCGIAAAAAGLMLAQ